MKEDCPPSSHVPISNSKSILKSELLSLLKTYNCYHEGRSFQLRHREALLLSICLRGPLGSAEGPVILGSSLLLGRFSWDSPKSQSRGSAVPGLGAAGCWALKWVVMSCRDPGGQLFSQARAVRWGLLGRTLAVAISSTEVGCAS
uniref:Ras association domain family member 4 n=1 Tax=Equus asinus TaxID=9793 RepID=A0A9L0I6Q7_EQUAS